MLNKGENKVGLQEVTLQPKSVWKNNLTALKHFKVAFFSLILEAKPLISNESVCLQSDEERNCIYLHLEELFLNIYFYPSQYFDQWNEISLP